MGETFTQMLLRFMEERKITRTKLYTDACMDRKLVSKILKHKRYPRILTNPLKKKMPKMFLHRQRPRSG